MCKIAGKGMERGTEKGEREFNKIWLLQINSAENEVSLRRIAVKSINK